MGWWLLCSLRCVGQSGGGRLPHVGADRVGPHFVHERSAGLPRCGRPRLATHPVFLSPPPQPQTSVHRCLSLPWLLRQRRRHPLPSAELQRPHLRGGVSAHTTALLPPLSCQSTAPPHSCPLSSVLFLPPSLCGLSGSPVTGRTHQIRLHLQHVGHPILNDPLYGGHLYDLNSYHSTDHPPPFPPSQQEAVETMRDNEAQTEERRLRRVALADCSDCQSSPFPLPTARHTVSSLRHLTSSSASDLSHGRSLLHGPGALLLHMVPLLSQFPSSSEPSSEVALTLSIPPLGLCSVLQVACVVVQRTSVPLLHHPS